MGRSVIGMLCVTIAAALAACDKSAPPPSAGAPVKLAEAPQPETTPPQVAAARAPARTAAPAAKRVIAFELSYLSRVLVPAGSDIEVVVKSADGKVLGAQKAKTTQDSPPYAVKVDIPTAEKGPLKVEASLKSRLGHTFGRTLDYDPATTPGSKPVEVVMQSR